MPETQPARQKKPRLIVFDVEGIVIPKRRYLLFEASRRVTVLKFIKMLWAGLLYETGLIRLETALRRIYKQLQGLPIDDLFQLFNKIPLIPGVEEVFQKLKHAGYKTALISSGLPQIFVDELAKRLGADYAFGFELEAANGLVSGQIGGDSVRTEGKALIMKKVMEQERLTPSDCAVVADDRNNVPMFSLCSTRIGYNPDFLLAYKSDVVVKGDLIEVLPYLTAQTLPVQRSVSKRDLFRENIHIAGFFVAFFTMYLGLSRFWVAFAILMVTLVYVISELARMLGTNIPIVATITWNAALQPEVYEFVTAPIFFAVGIMLALLLFPPPISYASIAVFTLGDGFATIFGKSIGKHIFPYNKGKKVEGTLFGFFFAVLGAAVFVNPPRAVLGAATAMIIETIPTPINDNVTIPLAAGLAMLLLP